jgi:hypothetical protein
VTRLVGGAARIRRTGFAIRAYRSDCPICRCGIYAGDETVWIVRPVTGTVHLTCKPKEN